MQLSEMILFRGMVSSEMLHPVMNWLLKKVPERIFDQLTIFDALLSH